MAGAATFASSCVACHAYQGKGVFNVLGKAPVSIDAVLTKYGSAAGLATYIVQNMPSGNPTSCTGKCAQDTAAFMASKLADVDTGPVTAACSAEDPITYGVRTLRTLTAREYRNTIVQAGLINATQATGIDLPGDVVRTKSDYAVHSALQIEGTRATAFDKAASKVAELAAPALSQSCGGNATTCATRFLEIAYLLHRQPLEQDEQQLYRGYFTEFGAADGMKVAIAAALTSPQFIYRSEMGVTVAEALTKGWTVGGSRTKLEQADADSYVLTPYEFASELAFMYSGTGPTKALLDLAASGGLNSDAGVQTAIDQLIASAAGRAHVEHFGSTWFRANDVVDESRPSFPAFTPDVAKDMATEVSKLFAEVWYNPSRTFEELYSGNFTVVNSRLAQFYGVSNFSGGTSDWRVTTVPNRGGMLTTGAFHAANANDLHTRPILKAVKLRELMLCHHLGAPQNMLADAASIAENQAAIVTTLRDGGGQASARQYYEASTVAAGCQVCHATQINPLFGIDDFDQVGRYRTTQTGLRLVDNTGLFAAGNAGVQVNAAGQLIGLSDLNDTASISYSGAKDLANKMASLPAVAECMVANSFRYTTGLAIDVNSVAKNGNSTVREDELSSEQVEDFACAKEVLLNTYETSGKKPMDVYRKIGTLDLVRFRK